MRISYINQLEILHTELIHMGSLCEVSIACAVKGLIDEDVELREKAILLEDEIKQKEREIEDFCLRLIIREQPVAGDLRRINAAQKIIASMARIGDQAMDIAEMSAFMVGSAVKSNVRIADMARAAAAMLQKSVDSFVANDIRQARETVAEDDVVDALFSKIKEELVEQIARDSASGEVNGGACLDLLMTAKYLERIADHAANIAGQVIYTVTGERGTP